MSEFLVRRMTTADLPGVLEIQKQCYHSGLLEGAEAFASRLTLSPATCAVAESIDDRTLAGYLFTHPWPQDSLPPLDGVLKPCVLGGTAAAAITWFVHDMAVAPAGRGSGLALRLYEAALRAALEAGLRHSRLIAVQAAAGWWRRLGYAPMTAHRAATHAGKLACYGPDAVIMECALSV
ncbi:GNAT family N-acetyltransferase [Cupriavidus sp. WKF15]|uniref:GNAT family N-acetyltransferase n=1 Tax=Cupriavidus sp. WKF15 TaxID=3032282 RepID=UPI0023E168A8|nr:GNAT family N-acetyltransferase [Cupriavidus sp. WKF15]WER45720.1 GNAT family N-acetyltransferase [Cupriavidus sp. WKF15]